MMGKEFNLNEERKKLIDMTIKIVDVRIGFFLIATISLILYLYVGNGNGLFDSLEIINLLLFVFSLIMFWVLGIDNQGETK